jgi:predicted 3-demethylubiquinone-9 3-methyltransferase (glyoxalase superfamily)
MHKITPHLWFDKAAKEAVEVYTSLIPNSKTANIGTLRETPSGGCDIVSFELSGQPFIAISRGAADRLVGETSIRRTRWR